MPRLLREDEESCLTRGTHLTTRQPCCLSFCRKQQLREQRRSTAEKSLFTMGRVVKETVGQIISFIGFVLAAVCSGIPMWRVTSYIGANIVTGQIVWDGLWMNCVMQSTGQMQCKLNESLMSLTPDLQAARALVIACLIFSFIGFVLSFVGVKCTSCLEKDASKANTVIISGCLIILSAVLILVPVCWSASVTITDFVNPLTVATQKRELGSAIYIGWVSSVCLLIGGIIFTTSCPPHSNYYQKNQGAQMYPYGPYMNRSIYQPAYAPASSMPYSASGTYVPVKPNAAPAMYSPRQYI